MKRLLSREGERFFAERDEILAAYLFGSAARGKASALSDIDIGVWIREETARIGSGYGVKADLVLALSRWLDFEPVDVVIVNDIGPCLRHRVVFCGNRLFVRDPDGEARLRDRILKEYMDYKAIRRIREGALPRRG